MLQAQIEAYLRELNGHLRERGVRGEICLYGGAVMCLVYNVRASTKDVDAVFVPAGAIRQAAQAIAERHQLRPDWLNDAVKGFIVQHERQRFLSLDHLDVFVPDAEYLLAMKCLAARVDTTDAEDIRFLVKRLGLSEPEEVFRIIEAYYPHRQIRPATRFFVEELMAS